MATPSKTQGTSLLSVQNLANNTVLISSAQDVSSKFRATVFVWIGRDTTTSLTAPVNVRVQASAKSSGDDTWADVAFVQTQIATAGTNALSGSSNASGQKTLTAASTNWSVSFASGDYVFIKNGTIGNSEFARLKQVTAATTVDAFDNLTNTQTSANVYNKAEMFTFDIDVLAIGRIRVAVDTLGTGQAVNVQSFMVTADSIA